MFGWMSDRGKDTWEFMLWYFLFAYIPVIPVYFIMSLKGVMGLSALVYAAAAWSVIYLMYTRSQKNKNYISA